MEDRAGKNVYIKISQKDSGGVERREKVREPVAGERSSRGIDIDDRNPGTIKEHRNPQSFSV